MEKNILKANQIIHRLEFALKKGDPVEALLRKANQIDWASCPKHVSERYNELSAEINTYLIH